MGERKILCKYYPADFDPAKIPRRRQPMNHQAKVRMMLPMSIRCTRCGNFIYRGTKINSMKENVVGKNYLGIKIFRFHMKCTLCGACISFRTDPKNSDYVVEFGATRNVEGWRKEDEETEEEKRKKRSVEEVGDPMESLEAKASSTKRQMDNDAALLEMKSLKCRYAAVSEDAKFEALKHRSYEGIKKRKLAEEEEEDAAYARAVFQRRKQPVLLRRVDDDDLKDSYFS